MKMITYHVIRLLLLCFINSIDFASSGRQFTWLDDNFVVSVKTDLISVANSSDIFETLYFSSPNSPFSSSASVKISGQGIIYQDLRGHFAVSLSVDMDANVSSLDDRNVGISRCIMVQEGSASIEQAIGNIQLLHANYTIPLSTLFRTTVTKVGDGNINNTIFKFEFDKAAPRVTLEDYRYLGETPACVFVRRGRRPCP